MAIPIRAFLNTGVRLLQIAFAGTVLAVSLSLQHVHGDDGRFVTHSRTLSFVAAVGGLTAAGGVFGLALTRFTCLVKYGRVVDLLGVMLNLAAGGLLAVKEKPTKEDCPTQYEQAEGYNGPKAPACGNDSKLDWLIGDKCENMGIKCRLSRLASVICFLIVALLLVTLAFGSFVKSRRGPPTVKRKERPDGDIDIDTGSTGIQTI